jgi:1,4-alpha-glucan branching enzyme
MTIAEESTAWPQVTRPPYLGGLGFSFKWNMGWMHDTLAYFSHDPIHRKYHQNDLTFAMLYHHNENFILPLSHDEVVHGKRSLLGRMPGDDWRRFANLRTLLGYQWLFPGKKLLFMGCEFGQWREWNHDDSLDWHLLEQPQHQGILQVVKDLNKLYRSEPALYERDFDWQGFTWIDCNDHERCVLSYLRKGNNEKDVVAVVCNYTPVSRTNYRIGVPFAGFWKELFNSDAKEYAGTGLGNLGGVTAQKEGSHGHPYSLLLTLPPLSVVVLKPEKADTASD